MVSLAEKKVSQTIPGRPSRPKNFQLYIGGPKNELH